MRVIFLLLVGLFFCFQTEAQGNTKIINDLLSQLSIKNKKIYRDFFKIKKMPNDATKKIVLLPFIKPDKEEPDWAASFDVYLLVINSKSNKIIHKFFQKDLWFSDAVGLDDVEIDDRAYEVQKNKFSFGIITSYEGSSNVDPVYFKELNLFYLMNGKLVRILEDFTIEGYSGQNNAGSWGTFNSDGTDTTKKLTMLKSLKNNFRDIKVLSLIKYTETKDDSVCFSKNSKLLDTLKFNGKRYPFKQY